MTKGGIRQAGGGASTSLVQEGVALVGDVETLSNLREIDARGDSVDGSRQVNNEKSTLLNTWQRNQAPHSQSGAEGGRKKSE